MYALHVVTGLRTSDYLNLERKEKVLKTKESKDTEGDTDKNKPEFSLSLFLEGKKNYYYYYYYHWWSIYVLKLIHS